MAYRSHQATMVTHQTNIVVEIVGTLMGDRAAVISSTFFGIHLYPVFLHAFLMICSSPFISVIT